MQRIRLRLRSVWSDRMPSWISKYLHLDAVLNLARRRSAACAGFLIFVRLLAESLPGRGAIVGPTTSEIREKTGAMNLVIALDLRHSSQNLSRCECRTTRASFRRGERQRSQNLWKPARPLESIYWAQSDRRFEALTTSWPASAAPRDKICGQFLELTAAAST